MHKKILLSIFVFILTLQTHLLAAVWPGDTWQTASPKSQGVDSTKLDQAMSYLASKCGSAGTEQAVVIRNGYIIWKGSDIDNSHNVWSASKSFTSTVLGLLIDDDKCTLDTYAKNYVSSLSSKYSGVKLRHFATMTSGYNALRHKEESVCQSYTPFEPAPPQFSPGSSFKYCDDAMNQFGNVLTRIAGRTMENLFRDRIANPIGMNDDKWDWADWGVVDGLVVNGGAGNKGKGIHISARELARFGLLFLNRGNWSGRQLISSSWVDQATSPQVPSSIPGSDGRYCCNWWRLSGAPVPTYMASGHNNNKCIVIRDWNMVIVRLGKDGSISNDIYATFLDKVEDALISSGESPTAQAPAGAAPAVVAMAAFVGKPLPIIPGAAGFGMETPAGSGRHLNVPNTRVIKVTNLNTGGPGSLKAALDAEGPRVVVFEVSGNIDFTPVGGLGIKHPYITVAGQTAPSPGIVLKGCELNVRASDVLLQHIRVRVGDLVDPNRPLRNEKSGWSQWSERDCMKVGRDCRRVVIDHCSFSWATDENVQTRGGDLTFIHNIFSEGLDSAKHHKGGHSRGLLIMKQGKNEGQNIAVIGNLFVHNKGRNPAANQGVKGVIANNLVEDANFAMKTDCTGRRGHQLISIMGNVIKRTRYPIIARAKHPDTRYYFAADNVFNGKKFASVAELWQDVFMPFEPGVPEVNRASVAPVAVPGLTVRPADEVEEWVLANAGARPADRDPVDKRVVSNVRNSTGKIIASQEDIGGWPKLAENRRKLVIPENPNGDDDGDGYTNLEEWLHGYAAEVEGRMAVGMQGVKEAKLCVASGQSL